jgi:predicted N-acetyltransferase YhbS
VSPSHGRLVGAVRLWNVTVGPGHAALLLGPLAVHPLHRNRAIGSVLMRRAIARARLAGHQAILLVGDAPYYSRFGFSSGPTCDLWMPGPFEPRRLLALELKPGAFDGARGLTGTAGRLVPAPDLAPLLAQDRRTERARARRARAT